jgi:hypothetical protein
MEEVVTVSPRNSLLRLGLPCPSNRAGSGRLAVLDGRADLTPSTLAGDGEASGANGIPLAAWRLRQPFEERLKR